MIAPLDLIFADNDGIVVIPSRKEYIIIKDLIDKLSMENNVSSEIARYSDPMEIVNKIGEF